MVCGRFIKVFYQTITCPRRPLLSSPNSGRLVQVWLYSICSSEIQSILESHDQTIHTHFWPCPPNKFLISFWFLWICIKMQKIGLFNQFIVHSSDTVNFKVPSNDWPHPFLTMPAPKIFNHLLICLNLYQHAKNQSIPLVYSWDTVNFRVKRPHWPYPLSTIPNQKFSTNFEFLWICFNMLKMRLFHQFTLEK